MKTARNVAIVILLLFVVAACAKPYTNYITARQGYNTALLEYLNWFDMQATEVQIYCRGVIDPQLERATAALNAWGHSLDMGQKWGAGDEFFDIQEVLMKDLMGLYYGREVHQWDRK